MSAMKTVIIFPLGVPVEEVGGVFILNISSSRFCYFVCFIIKIHLNISTKICGLYLKTS